MRSELEADSVCLRERTCPPHCPYCATVPGVPVGALDVVLFTVVLEAVVVVFTVVVPTVVVPVWMN
jgi:hypothetical protein